MPDSSPRLPNVAMCMRQIEELLALLPDAPPEKADWPHVVRARDRVRLAHRHLSTLFLGDPEDVDLTVGCDEKIQSLP